MSEQSPISVDQAFNPEQRQAQKDFDAYLESRPYQDEQGNTHHPENHTFINSDQYFDGKRDAAQAEGQTPYKEMPMSELARKLAQAEHYEDKTMENDVHEVLLGKITKQHKKTKSFRDIEHNGQRMDNLVDRVMSVKDRELERLKAEEPESGEPEDTAEDSGKPDNAQSDESDHIPDWVSPTLDKAEKDRTDYIPNWVKTGSEEESIADTQKLGEVDKDNTGGNETLLFEPGGIGQRVRQAMTAAANKLRELPTRGFAAGQAKLATTQEFYNDDDRGQRRRKITAAVVGAVGLAGLSYLAHKGADVSGGVSHPAGEVSQTPPHAAGLEVQPIFPGAGKVHQHMSEAVNGMTPGAGKHVAAHEMTLHHGHTIWDDEQHMIAQHHANLSPVELQGHTEEAVDETLQANGLSYEDARHLPDNFRYHIPPHLHAEMLGNETR
jgi:hypothetical protein